MVLRPLKYGVTTILIINFSNYDTMITQIWFYTILTSNLFKNWRRIYFKIIHNFEGTMILNYCLFRRTSTYRRDYELKTIINSEGTLNRKGTMVLKTLLIPKGQKMRWREERLVNTSQEREKRERVPDNSMKLFGVIF